MDQHLDNLNPELKAKVVSAIEEAAEIGTPLIVLVCGADPTQSLEDSRKSASAEV